MRRTSLTAKGVEPRPIQRLLVANRSEIAIRVFRAATELGIHTIAVYADEDKLSLHRFKADEAYLVGRGGAGDLRLGPLEAYLSVEEVVRVARAAGADAIHPGYGFLSESPEFAEACAAAGVTFIGPSPETMRTLGNKVAARELALSVEVPVMPATNPLPDDEGEVRRLAAGIGYPVMLKASWGGGGRGMRPIEGEQQLIDAVRSARREAKAAFGKDEVYLEKLVRRARHVEVQILGDRHGTVMHLFERDCSIQRRNQKIVERAPAAFLDEGTRRGLCEAALRIGRATNYVGAGTVEFLLDADSGRFHFIEVNPRIQVEHTVTEQVTGLDVVKAQIRIIEGGRLGVAGETGVPRQTAYAGAVVTRHYDALLEKVTAWAPTAEEAIARMVRAVREYRIRGVATNLPFLEALLTSARFRDGSYTTRFVDETPELFARNRRRDRATKLLTYIADVSVNGHPDTRDRPRPPAEARAPSLRGLCGSGAGPAPEGTRALLDRLGPKGFADWMRAETRVLVTDTTMRDAHQSLLATRVRTYDIAAAAHAYAAGLPGLLSLECWGGATFDVAMRFLNEDPWERLALVREAVPGVLTQMLLLRGANGVGYANYPDNVVRHFVREAARGGMDVFRIFDCLNWVENMRVAIDAVAAEGKVAEGAICYTGDVLDPSRAKYPLAYYVGLARELERAGCHVLAIKDMAGLLKPAAARVLVKALREEVGLPLHLHTHDTFGIAGATVLAAVEAGVDAIDAATDALSGTTSQPCLGSLIEALRHGERDTGLDPAAVRRISLYWEAARRQYAAFESDLRSSASEVYLHEMPGGQFTNLKEQARSLGLERRWDEVARAYRAANDLFGDIVKVTPSSKVVGDMALMMVSQGIGVAELLADDRDVAFPASVVEMMRGDLGQPPGGWPPEIQRRVLKGEAPRTTRPGSLLGEADLTATRKRAEAACGRRIDERELASYLMYPKVFTDFCAAARKWGPVSALPTPVFFYGMAPGGEVVVAIERGKTLVVRLIALSETDEEGQVRVFFELNGQPRTVVVPDRSAKATRPVRRKAEDGREDQLAAPMPGSVAAVAVLEDQAVQAGEVLVTIEAMKMETQVRAPFDGTVVELVVAPGQTVDAKDLLVVVRRREGMNRR